MLSSVYGAWMRTESLTTICVSAQRVGRLSTALLAYHLHMIIGSPRDAYVLDIASNNSCASRLTPLPFCASFFFISRIVCSSRACSAARSTFEMLGSAPSKPGVDSDARSPEPMISNDSMCAKGMMWKSPGRLARGTEGFSGTDAVLMAMAWVMLQAVKSVPSSTLLFGAHVILML